MLQVDRAWPQDIGALAILEGGALLDPIGRLRIDETREAIRSRLHRVPRFRQRLHVPRRGLGGPLWVDCRELDLVEHVRVRPLPPGSGESELLAAIEELRRDRLDPSRPLWAMWFLPGLAEGRVGLFIRIHHAIADGMAAMAIVAALLDPVPDTAPTAPQPWTPARPPRERDLRVDNVVRRVRAFLGAFSFLGHPKSTLRGVRAAWPAAREILAEEPAPRTSLDRLIGPDRSLALVRTEIDAVKAAAHAADATVNDVLLAATAAGLRALLRHRGEPVDGTTARVFVPVSLRRGRLQLQGNLIAQMVVPLPLGAAEPIARLRRIATETGERKGRSRAPLGTLFRGGILTKLLLKAVVRQRVNVGTANIHGPEEPLYLAGARLLEVFPVLNLIGNVALSVGALSYAGAFDICVIADADAYPDLEVFAAGLRDELRALGIPTDRRSGSAAAVA
jgi:WS/DGAT/MGAT family acyltransferase